MAHRDLFGIVLQNREDFPLSFVECPGSDNIRKIQKDRKLLVEERDADLLDSYRRNVGTVHQCQMPWIVGFGVNGGKPHTIPDGRTLWQFINDEVGPLTGKNHREWVQASLDAVLELLPEYIDGNHTMRVTAEQGDLLNLCGGVMVSRVGYNPVHALLLTLAGMGFTGNTYNSPGVDTSDFAHRVKEIYLPEDCDPDEYVLLLRNTGGEATFLAMQAAKEATGKHQRIGYEGSYHGRFEYVDVDYFEHVVKFPDRLTGTSEDNSVDELRECFRAHGDKIGSLIMEGVQGGACYLPGRLGDGTHFYDAVRNLCDEYGVLFVMDLVQVNGLTGSWNPVQEAGAKKGPHIYALGKGYSEAYPLSGVLLPKTVAGTLQVGGWTSTHSMHWQGATVGMGIFLVNDYLKKEFGKDLMECSRPNAEYFSLKLDDMAEKYDGELGTTIQHQGMKRGFMHSLRFSSMEFADRFVEGLTKVGCYVFDTIKRADYSTVKLFPPLLSTQSGLDEALFCIEYSLQEAGRKSRDDGKG
ncbi:aminotransferase class III-fold pyridoxal phosphate-dependent enzyme [Candidatus Poribacteria bacterium]